MNKKFFLSSFIIAAFYLMLFVYLTNHSLVTQTLGGSYPLEYKISLLWNLLGGLSATLSGAGEVLVILVALFTGLNLSLGFQKLKNLKSGYSIFPGAFLGILGSGCGACGVPILSIIGFSGTFLPFKGMVFSVLALGFLVLSFVFLLRTPNFKACKV